MIEKQSKIHYITVKLYDLQIKLYSKNTTSDISKQMLPISYM